MKQFISEKDDPLFLVLKTFEANVGVKLDIQSIFNNFYPKIMAVVAILYSFVNIAILYNKYDKAVPVPVYWDAFWQ